MAENELNMDLSGRELPYSREAELAVIGSILADKHSIAEAAAIISGDDFYYPQNR